MAICVICDSSNAGMEDDGRGGVVVNCKQCGWYQAVLDELADIKKEKPKCMPRLSHRLRRMQSKDRPILLEHERINALIADPLPSVREQQETLLVVIGDELREEDPSGSFQISGPRAAYLTSWIGAFHTNALFQIVGQLKDAGLIEWRMDGSNPVWLKPSGWERYEEIKRSPSQARLAFMAMPFNHPELDHVYNECFKGAAKETGFTLRRVDEGQPAGLIDDQLRVRIRAVRFLIAELTTENRGVYWEAGFAEGLGLPVIYTCKKSAEPALQTHFDTNHHLTVQWEAEKLGEAALKLKATIRATLPTEAIQSDE